MNPLCGTCGHTWVDHKFVWVPYMTSFGPCAYPSKPDSWQFDPKRGVPACTCGKFVQADPPVEPPDMSNVRMLLEKMKEATSYSLCFALNGAVFGAIYVMESKKLISHEEGNKWTLAAAEIFSGYRSPEQRERDAEERELRVKRALLWLYDHGFNKSYTYLGPRRPGYLIVCGVITILLKRGLIGRSRRTFKLTATGLDEAKKEHLSCEGGRRCQGAVHLRSAT